MKGLIIAGTNNLFTVECDDEKTRLCTIKGKVLKSDKEFYNPLAPGDFVEIEIDSLNDEKGQIITLQERKNTFLRWNVKGRCPQLLASNLDYLILVTTPCEPPFRPRFIDRALAQNIKKLLLLLSVINGIWHKNYLMMVLLKNTKRLKQDLRFGKIWDIKF